MHSFHRLIKRKIYCFPFILHIMSLDISMWQYGLCCFRDDGSWERFSTCSDRRSVSTTRWLLSVSLFLAAAQCVEMDGACGWSRFSFPTAGAFLSRQLSLDQLIMMAYLWCLIVMIYSVNKYICEDSICSIGMKKGAALFLLLFLLCLFYSKEK